MINKNIIAAQFNRKESEDSSCKEHDGCPTENAVLKRFWREHQHCKNADISQDGQRAAVPEGQRIWILMNESDEEPVMFYTERPSETFKSHMKLKEFMLFDPSELPTGRPAWEYYFTHSSATGRSDTEVGPCLTYDKAQAFGVGCSRQRELVISAPSQPQQEAVPAEQSEQDKLNAERLEFMAVNEALINYNIESTKCRVLVLDENGNLNPICGHGDGAWKSTPREAIDAAIAMSAAKEPGK